MFFDRSLIAVDIGSSSVKMIELAGKGASKKLKSFAIEYLPQGAIEDGVIQDSSVVKDIVAQMAESMGVKGRRAAVSLSGSGVLIRRITVPVGKDVVLEEQIPFHAEQAFQVDPAGLYYDFAKVASDKKVTDEQEILLVGARREIVENYVVCVREAGLRLGVMECNAFSLFNAFEQNYGTLVGLVCLINVGASNTQISFILDGKFLFSRDIALAGLTYSRRIMELLQISYSEAEDRKVKFSTTGVAPQGEEILRIMQDVNEQIVHEVNGTLSYFMRAGDVGPDHPLKYIFLTGGASRTPGLDQALAMSLKAPIYPMNPFQRIEVDKGRFSLEEVGAKTSMLGIAVGLGLRSMQDKAEEKNS